MKETKIILDDEILNLDRVLANENNSLTRAYILEFWTPKAIQVQARVSPTEQQPQWIHISDKQPKLGQKVLLKANAVVQEEIYKFDEAECGAFWSRDDIDECPLVTDYHYWMPLPKA